MDGTKEFSAYREATESCNTSMEREFCRLSEFVRLKKLRLLIKSRDWFKQDLGEFAYADLNSNFNFRGCLRSIWPQKFHISSFSFKYHIAIAFVHLRMLTGHFAIDLILLLKLAFLHISLWPQ